MQNSPRHLRGCNIYCCFSDTGVLIPQDYKQTDPDFLLTMGPFLRAIIIKNYVYLFVILWYPTLQVSFIVFTVLYSSFFVNYSIPQTFTVYQTLAVSLLAMFFGKFLGFLGLNSTFFQLGGQFQIGQDCFSHDPL